MVILFQEVVIQRNDPTNLRRQRPLDLKPETTSLSPMGMWVHRGPSSAPFPALEECNTDRTRSHRRPAGMTSTMEFGKPTTAVSPALTRTPRHLQQTASNPFLTFRELRRTDHFQDLLPLTKPSSLMPPASDWETCSRGVRLRERTLLSQEQQIRGKMEAALRVHLDLSPSLSALEAEISPVIQRNRRYYLIKTEHGLK